MKECYTEKNFAESSLLIIVRANEILGALRAEGYRVTLRQLYYRFVAADLLPNTVRSYKRLGSIIGDARLAGLIDWNDIEDRTRFIRSPSHWESPADMVDACAEQFAVDKWSGQPYYVEVWVEKDALIGVVEAACKPLDVACFSCRGYVSLSEMRDAAQRLESKAAGTRDVVILHLGDHDPSGQDMTRDIRDRLATFSYDDEAIEVRRIALNFDQIEQYAPPPNPAKVTDSRYEKYEAEYGTESWELDALEPRVLDDLIRTHILELRDDRLWAVCCFAEQEGREALASVALELRDDK